MATVGIIANPAAGRDVRRLVAYGRFISKQEKVNILKRLLNGLRAMGVDHIVMMPDVTMLGRAALDGLATDMKIEFLEMDILNEQADSSKAAELMAAMGAGCIVTLGGDGTNRAVAESIGETPLLPVSTGTNNVFPSMVEGTLAGLAAGVIARGLVKTDSVSAVSNILEVCIDGAPRDIALVDVAVCKDRSIGARAVWRIETLRDVFIARPDPGVIGLSAIGAHLLPSPPGDRTGVHVRIGEGGTAVLTPLAPGKLCAVPVSDWLPLHVGEPVCLDLPPCTVALDGERAISLPRARTARITLIDRGPRVVSAVATLRQAALGGVFIQEDLPAPR